MTRDEVKQLLAIIQATFTNFVVKDKVTAIESWHMLLEEYEANDVMLAFKAYCKSNDSGFAPSVSQLICQIEKPKDLAVMDEAEAWKIARNAIGMGTKEGVFAKLPEPVQKAIGSAEVLRSWATDADYNEAVVMSLFQKNYRTICQRTRDYEKMPVEFQARIEQIREKNIKLLDNNTYLIGQTDKLQEGDFNYDEPPRPDSETIREYARKIRQELGADD